MSMMWTAIGTTAVGVGANLYGANKQSQAAKDAAKQNAASQAEQNAAAWSNYLMTRGINPSGAQTGQIPQNAKSINARLPLWATVRQTTTPQGKVSINPSPYPQSASAGGQWRKPIGYSNGRLVYADDAASSTAPGSASLGSPLLQ